MFLVTVVVECLVGEALERREPELEMLGVDADARGGVHAVADAEPEAHGEKVALRELVDGTVDGEVYDFVFRVYVERIPVAPVLDVFKLDVVRFPGNDSAVQARARGVFREVAVDALYVRPGVGIDVDGLGVVELGTGACRQGSRDGCQCKKFQVSGMHAKKIP